MEELLKITIEDLSKFPPSPSLRQIYFNTDTKLFMRWNGKKWEKNGFIHDLFKPYIDNIFKGDSYLFKKIQQLKEDTNDRNEIKHNPS